MRTILSILTFLLGIVCLGAAGNLESFTQIDLSQAVNMGFVDETARDGERRMV